MMAIGFNANGEHIRALADFVGASEAPYTRMAWVKHALETGVNYEKYWMDWFDAGSGAVQLYRDPNTNRVTLWDGGAQHVGGIIGVAWTHLCVTAEQGGGFTLYIDAVDQMIGSPQHVDRAINEVMASSDEADSYLNGSLCAWKEWAVRLDAGKIAAERTRYQPFHLADLHRYCPNRTVAEAGLDLSGNGHNMEVVGTLSEEAGPDIIDLDVSTDPGYRVRRVNRVNRVNRTEGR